MADDALARVVAAVVKRLTPTQEVSMSYDVVFADRPVGESVLAADRASVDAEALGEETPPGESALDDVFFADVKGEEEEEEESRGDDSS